MNCAKCEWPLVSYCANPNCECAGRLSNSVLSELIEAAKEVLGNSREQCWGNDKIRLLNAITKGKAYLGDK